MNMDKFKVLTMIAAMAGITVSTEEHTAEVYVDGDIKAEAVLTCLGSSQGFCDARVHLEDGVNHESEAWAVMIKVTLNPCMDTPVIVTLDHGAAVELYGRLKDALDIEQDASDKLQKIQDWAIAQNQKAK